VSAPPDAGLADKDEPEPFRPGMLIGHKFVLLRFLAAGAMGAVYEAKDELIQRHVAIKLLRPDLVRRSDLIRRFRREAELTASVQHPNVVTVLEMGQREDGSLYIVQELLQGETLRGHLNRRGPCAFEEAADILLPVMGALICAHALGIIHRDIKPGNIILTRPTSGELVPKLIDFGIAKAPDPGASGVTEAGALLGTPHYMSPEQLGGPQPLDPRTDVWALGVLFYEMLSGAYPRGNRHDPVHAVLTKILTDRARPLRSVAAHVPEPVAALIHRAIEQDVARRLPSMQVFRDELLALLGRGASRSPSIAPPPPEDAAGAAGTSTTAPLRAPHAPEEAAWLDLEDLTATQRSPDAPPPAASASRSGPLVPAAARSEVDWIEDEITSRSEQDLDAEAAERALEVNRLEEAVSHAERALAGSPPHAALSGRMWLVQAIAHRWLGNYEAAARCAHEAAAHLRPGSGGWYTAVGYVIVANGQLGNAKLLLSMEEDLQRIDVSDDRASFHALVLCRLVVFLIRNGYPRVADHVVAEADRLAGVQGDAEPLVRAWLDVARAEHAAHRGDQIAYLWRVESAVEAFTAAGDVRNACLQRANIGNAYMQLGAHRRAVAVLREALDVAAPMGLDFAAGVQVNLGFALAQLGRIDEGIAAETAAHDACIHLGNHRFASCALIYLAALCSMRGEVDAAVALAKQAVGSLAADTPLRAYALATLARQELLQRRPAPALIHAAEAMALLNRLGGVEEGEFLIRTIYALSLRASGREAEGRSELADARRRLVQRAERIKDAAWRRSFLEGVPDHALLLDLAAQWLDGRADSGAPRR